MAAKSTTKSRTAAAKKPAPKKSRAKPRAKAAPKKATAATFTIPGVEGFGKLPKALTPEQAIELYKANARMALDVINAAIDSTAKMRRLQFAGEEEARAMHKKVMRDATEASNGSTWYFFASATKACFISLTFCGFFAARSVVWLKSVFRL